MSDTPRTTDRVVFIDGNPWVNAPFAVRLELELKAANERIKRLEEAGDAIAKIIGPPGSAHWADENQVDAAWNNWRKAKEAKP